MLVLSRKIGQEIVLPRENVRITVIGTKGNTVRLGFAAPPDTPVHRQEVWDRICGAMDAVAQIDNDGPSESGSVGLD